MQSIDDLTFIHLKTFVESCGGWGDFQEKIERKMNDLRRSLDAQGFPIQMGANFHHQYLVPWRKLETFREFFHHAVALEDAGKSGAADIAAGQALIRRKAFTQVFRITDQFPDWPLHNDSNQQAVLVS